MKMPDWITERIPERVRSSKHVRVLLGVYLTAEAAATIAPIVYLVQQSPEVGVCLRVGERVVIDPAEDIIIEVCADDDLVIRQGE